ncbi:MAG: Uma2 family endonuclease [Salinibacter sp.]|uniref:Uma2 family endonuclease n=1 Tax=Salinibacter sp. TaxID=2065818 RepID=UPI0035D42A74
MPAPTTTRAKEHQARWKEIVQDPSLQDLPYKVETNSRGQIVLSPHTTHHARQQKAVQKKLDQLLTGGEAFSEWPIATSGGTKQADVIWTSDGRLREMDETGDPPTLAPEICVEVMSESNDWAEMEEKRRLYREAGAAEVWVVSEDGEVHFSRDEEVGQSEIVPAFPDQL